MTVASREQQILDHLSLVRFIVNRLPAELRANVDREDLISTGVVGLIKAVDRFDPQRGVKFETYASCLIRGEIMESLRAQDTAWRSLRRRGRELARLTSELGFQLGRCPQPSEIAEAMGLALHEYHTILRQLEITSEVSLEESMERNPQVEQGELTTPDGSTALLSDPALLFERQSFLELITQGVGMLPEREQAVLALYYGDDMKLREIGELFGITESRVCQLHAQALRRMKSSLAEEWDIAA